MAARKFQSCFLPVLLLTFVADPASADDAERIAELQATIHKQQESLATLKSQYSELQRQLDHERTATELGYDFPVVGTDEPAPVLASQTLWSGSTSEGKTLRFRVSSRLGNDVFLESVGHRQDRVLLRLYCSGSSLRLKDLRLKQPYVRDHLHFTGLGQLKATSLDLKYSYTLNGAKVEESALLTLENHIAERLR